MIKLLLSLVLSLTITGFSSQTHATALGDGNLDFSGTISFQASGDSVSISIASIVNSSSSYTSGSLQLELWAAQSPYNGSSLSGYKTASIRTNQINGLSDQLGPNATFSNINLTIPFTEPAAGYTCFTLLLTMYSSTCTSSDNFCIIAYSNLSSSTAGGGNDFTITGTLVDSSGGGIAGAEVTLEGDGETYSEISDSNGNFSLTFNRTDIPDTVAFIVVKDGYIPLAHSLTLGNGDAIDTGNLILEAQSSDIVVLELVPELHHLGDDSFGGSANSQFQSPAEYKKTFTRAFDVTIDQLTASSVTISLLAKGLQISNELRVNANLIGFLDSSPDDGSFGSITFSNIPISYFVEGRNWLFIESVSNGFNYDDFEFTNVIICFNGTGSNETQPSVPAIPSFVAASGAYGSVSLSNWTEQSDASSYSLYRCTSSDTSTCELAASGISSTSYDDTQGDAGVWYYYRIAACNSAGCSELSYSYGYGRAIGHTVNGTVVDTNGAGLAGATFSISALSQVYTVVTDSAGNFSLEFNKNGLSTAISFTVEKVDYVSVEQTFTLTFESCDWWSTIDPNIVMEVGDSSPNIENNFTLTGVVTDNNGNALAGAEIKLAGEVETFVNVTESNGGFSLSFDRAGLPDIVAYTIAKEGYIPLAQSLDLSSGSSFATGSLVLEIQGLDVVIVEVVPDVHHLVPHSWLPTLN